MSRCVEKSFAPCWQCGRTRVFRLVPHRAVTAWGERVFCYGRAIFLSEQTECRSPVTEMPLPHNRNAAPPLLEIGTASAVTRQGGRCHWATVVGRWHTA